MPDNEYTSKFKVDITDLKKGIQEANKQMQLANAEFKAASAGMDDWEKSSDGISSKLKQLRTVLEAQKSKLNAYNEEQKRMDDAAEENGKRADELRKKLAQLASQGVSKTSEEYKTCRKALEDCEKEQENNKKASDALKVTILNQQAAINKTEKEIRNFTSTEKGLTEKLSDQKKELEKLKTEYVDATAKYGKNSDEAKALAKRINDLSGEIVSEEKSVKSASEAADRFDKSMDEAGDSAQKAGKKASESASLFSKLAEVLKNGVASAAKTAVSAFAAYTTAVVSLGSTVASAGLSTYADFESKMSAVKALMSASCETTEELEQATELLTGTAKELGSTTKYTAAEVAKGMEKMALAGWKANEIIDGIPGVLNLAAADEMDLAAACSIVTDYLNAFSWEANRAEEFVDIMAKAMSTSNTTTTELGEAYKNCASTASSLGYTVEETTAVLATMANAGVKGGEAGTALNAIMTRLATDTKGCATELAEYGVHVYDAHGNMQSLSSILQGVSDVWGGLTDQQQANLAKTIAGTNQYSALQTIMGGLSEELDGTGKGFADYAEAFEDCEGTAEKMAAIKLDNLKGQITLLKSSAEGAAIAIGEQLAPAATEAVKSVKSILDAFNEKGLSGALSAVSRVTKTLAQKIRYELPKILHDLIGDFNSIFMAVFDSAGAILPALIGKILPIFLSGFQDLVTSVISGISGMLPDFIKAITKVIPGVSQAFDAIISAIIQALPQLIEAVITLIPQITQAILGMLPQLVALGVQLITSLLSGLGKMLPEIVIQIVDIIPMIVSALTAGIHELLQGAIQFLMAIVDAVPEIVKAFMAALPQIVESVVDCLQKGIPMLIQGAVSLLMAVIDAIPLIIPVISESLPAIVNAIVTGLIGCTDMLAQGSLQLLTAIIQAIPPLISMLIPQIVSIVKTIIRILADNAPLLVNASITLFMTILQAIPVILSELAKTVPSIIGGIIQALIGGIALLVRAVYELGTAFINAFMDFFGIHSPSKLMQEKAKFLVDGIVEGIKNMPAAMWNVLKKAYDKVVKWASEMAVKGKEGAKKLFDNVVDGVKNLPDKLFSIGSNIVSGLWNGISGAAGWLADKVKGFATGILDNMKSSLGINSPSRVMRDMVGKFIPAGIAVGIDQNAKAAVNSMKNLAAQLIPTMDGLKTGVNVPTSGNTGTSGSNIVQNFYQTNNSPKALSRLERYRQTKNLLDYAKVVMP